MKKMLGLLIILSILYFGIQLVFSFVEKGHVIEYSIIVEDNIYDIKETFTLNVKDEVDNYYFSISINENDTFIFQSFEEFNMQSKIIKDIKYYRDSTYTCILPIFTNNTIASDIICKKNDNYYLYNTIKGQDVLLDEYVVTLKDIGYDIDSYNINDDYINDSSGLKVYKSLIEDHYLSIENYKGLYIINSMNTNTVDNIKIFSTDIYTKPISAFVGNYYIIADYTKKTKFNKFNLVNLKTNTKDTIVYDYDISLNSYVQGVVNNSVYIYDRDNLKQYELNVKTKTIIEVGNNSLGIKYYENNEFKYIDLSTVVNNNVLFSEFSTSNILNDITYAKVDKTGNLLSGYYYIYQLQGSVYKLYRANVQDSTKLTYLLTLSDIDDVLYYKDYIYYKDFNSIKLYSDNFGVKTLVEYSELQFNSDIKIGLYVK